MGPAPVVLTGESGESSTGRRRSGPRWRRPHCSDDAQQQPGRSVPGSIIWAAMPTSSYSRTGPSPVEAIGGLAIDGCGWVQSLAVDTSTATRFIAVRCGCGAGSGALCQSPCFAQPSGRGIGTAAGPGGVPGVVAGLADPGQYLVTVAAELGDPQVVDVLEVGRHGLAKPPFPLGRDHCVVAAGIVGAGLASYQTLELRAVHEPGDATGGQSARWQG